MIIVRPQDPHLSLFSATVIVASVWLVSIVIAIITIIITVGTTANLIMTTTISPFGTVIIVIIEMIKIIIITMIGECFISSALPSLQHNDRPTTGLHSKI